MASGTNNEDYYLTVEDYLGISKPEISRYILNYKTNPKK